MTVTGRNSSSSNFRGEYRIVDVNNPYVGYYENTGYLEGSLCRLYPGTAGVLVPQSAVADQAWIDFVKKAKNAQRAFQGGVFVGELKEAILSIVHPAKAIRKGLDEYVSVLRRRGKPASSDRARYEVKSRKRKFSIYRGSDYVWDSDYVITRVPKTRSNYGVSRRRALARMVHDTWLEYSFGWKPLYNDIISGAKALGDLAYKPDSKRVTGKAGREARSNPVDARMTMADASEFVMSVDYRTWRSESYSVKFHGEVSTDTKVGEFVTNKAKHLGFSWEELAPTLWELIPYSFLVDYFTNIGELIEVASFNQASIMWSYRGTKRSTKWNAMALKTILHETDPAYEIKTHSLKSPGPCDVEDFEIRRQPTGYPQPPSLSFKVPGIGSTKWINMAALAASRDKLRRELRI
jgi:hypothetical protein